MVKQNLKKLLSGLNIKQVHRKKKDLKEPKHCILQELPQAANNLSYNYDFRK